LSVGITLLKSVWLALHLFGNMLDVVMLMAKHLPIVSKLVVEESAEVSGL